MHREYHRNYSAALGRDMESLVFGHAGLPIIVFPTSQARFYEFEDRGMVGAVADKLDRGEIQLWCVDSVDSESWYARDVPGRWRIARHLQYERYVVDEVIPHIRWRTWRESVAMLGCSFGGFHAASMALRHPDVVTAVLTMSGAFDMVVPFLRGYHDLDTYMVLPTHFLPNLHDSWHLDRMRRNTYILATGVHDQCWNDNEQLAGMLRSKGVPVRLEVWGDNARHDWPWWQRMVQTYL